MHDRRWHVLSVRPELIVMQMIDDGQLIAQCNLRSLPATRRGEATSLSHFQEEIRTALGSAAQQIIDSNESMQPNGVRQLRVSVVGQVANAPVHWIYYQLTDSSRQLADLCVYDERPECRTLRCRGYRVRQQPDAQSARGGRGG